MKRLLTLVLAMLMCFGLLCACGEPTDEENKGAPGTDSAKERMSKIHYTYTREKDVYTDGEGSMEQIMEIEYTENANCPINNEWADFFLANLFDVT